MDISVKVWVLHQGCHLCRILQDNGNKILLQFESGLVFRSTSYLICEEQQFPKDQVIAECEGCLDESRPAHDLIGLPFLNNAIIFNTLQARYYNDTIYVCVPCFLSLTP